MWDLALLAQWCSAPAAVSPVGKRRLSSQTPGWCSMPDLWRLLQCAWPWWMERYGQSNQTWHRLPWFGVPQSPLVLLGSAINQCVNPLPSLFLSLFYHFARNNFSWGFQALMGSLWFLTVYNSNEVKWNLMGESISLAWGFSVCWILTVSCKLQR